MRLDPAVLRDTAGELAALTLPAAASLAGPGPDGLAESAAAVQAFSAELAGLLVEIAEGLLDAAARSTEADTSSAVLFRRTYEDAG